MTLHDFKFLSEGDCIFCVDNYFSALFVEGKVYRVIDCDAEGDPLLACEMNPTRFYLYALTKAQGYRFKRVEMTDEEKVLLLLQGKYVDK